MCACGATAGAISPMRRRRNERRRDRMEAPAQVELTKTPSFRLDGKRALVTGAGRGIGLAAAAALAEAGAQVTLAARTRGEIDAAAAAIRARGQATDALALDVTELAAVQAAVAA